MVGKKLGGIIFKVLDGIRRYIVYFGQNGQGFFFFILWIEDYKIVFFFGEIVKLEIVKVIFYLFERSNDGFFKRFILVEEV